MVFTFTLFPNDLPDVRKEHVGKYEANCLKTENIKDVKNGHHFTISSKIQSLSDKENFEDENHDKIGMLMENPSSGSYNESDTCF